MERTIARALIVLALLAATGGVLLAASSDDPRCYAMTAPQDDPVTAPPPGLDGSHPTEVCLYGPDEIVLPPVVTPSLAPPGLGP